MWQGVGNIFRERWPRGLQTTLFNWTHSRGQIAWVIFNQVLMSRVQLWWEECSHFFPFIRKLSSNYWVISKVWGQFKLYCSNSEAQIPSSTPQYEDRSRQLSASALRRVWGISSRGGRSDSPFLATGVLEVNKPSLQVKGLLWKVPGNSKGAEESVGPEVVEAGRVCVQEALENP